MIMLVSAAAFSLARVPAFAAAGLSALTLAILIGAVLGHFGHRALTGQTMQLGLVFAHAASGWGRSLWAQCEFAANPERGAGGDSR